jgi:UDP-glucose 4-epimerase
MSQHVLVTGGTGYIGGAPVRLLLQNNFHVTVLDDLSRGHRSSVPPVARLLVGNIADAALLNHLFAESPIAAVMHFAAFAGVGESMQNPALYFRNNTAATLTLLEAPTDAAEMTLERPARTETICAKDERQGYRNPRLNHHRKGCCMLLFF